MNNILSRDKVREVIEQTNGKFFNVVFIKISDNTTRIMTCRTGVQKHLKGGSLAYDPKKQGQYGNVIVWEKSKEHGGADAYRSFSIDTVTELTIEGKTWRVMDVLPGGLENTKCAESQEMNGVQQSESKIKEVA